MLLNGNFERGKVNILNLASIGFMVLSLATVSYVAANPNIRQFIGASAGKVKNLRDIGNPRARQAAEQAYNEGKSGKSLQEAIKIGTGKAEESKTADACSALGSPDARKACQTGVGAEKFEGKGAFDQARATYLADQAAAKEAEAKAKQTSLTSDQINTLSLYAQGGITTNNLSAAVNLCNQLGGGDKCSTISGIMDFAKSKLNSLGIQPTANQGPKLVDIVGPQPGINLFTNQPNNPPQPTPPTPLQIAPAPIIGAKEGESCFDSFLGISSINRRCSSGLHCSSNVCEKDTLPAASTNVSNKAMGADCSGSNECGSGSCASSYLSFGKPVFVGKNVCTPSLAIQDAGVIAQHKADAEALGIAALVINTPLLPSYAAAVSVYGSIYIPTVISSLPAGVQTLITAASPYIAPVIIVGSTLPFAVNQTIKCGFMGSNFENPGCQAAQEQSFYAAVGLQQMQDIEIAMQSQKVTLALTTPESLAESAARTATELPAASAATEQVTNSLATNLTTSESLAKSAAKTATELPVAGGAAEEVANSLTINKLDDLTAQVTPSKLTKLTTAADNSTANLLDLDISGLSEEEQNLVAQLANAPTVPKIISEVPVAGGAAEEVTNSLTINKLDDLTAQVTPSKFTNLTAADNSPANLLDLDTSGLSTEERGLVSQLAGKNAVAEVPVVAELPAAVPSDLTKVTVAPDGDPFVSAGAAYQAESTPALTRRVADIQNQVANLDAQKVAQIVYDAKYTDGLTGLVNRTGFAEGLDLEVASSAKTGTDLTVVTMDLNKFKTINDTLGHTTGDDALKTVADLLKKNARSTDLVVRISGDEFALVLPQTNEEQAQVLIQRILAELENQKSLASPDNFIHSININYGVRQWAQTDTVNGFLNNLDVAMYEQKRGTSPGALQAAWNKVKSFFQSPAVVGIGGLVPSIKIITEKVSPIKVSPIEEGPPVVVQNKEPVTFVYFSQKDSRWQDIPTKGKASIYDDGCGIVTGAMVTGTDPHVYWGLYNGYFKSKGQERLVTLNGTSVFDHKEVLESLGYKLIPVAGSSKDIKKQIAEYSANGIPVWINAEIWSGSKWVGHNTEAIGVDSDENIIFNDPWYGQNVSIPDKRIDIGTEDNDPGWVVYAVVPPGKTP